MIYSVNFVEMAEKINHLAFVQYLKETGWESYPFKRDDVKIFQYIKGDAFEQVIIPMDKTLSDYKNAIYHAVETVASVENKSVEQVMLYLLNPNTDIIKIRLDKKGMESGNILFDDAIRLYDSAKRLLAATALDIIKPNKYHHGRPDERVQQFLSQCRFGQTEIGSYVVSVVCPFAEIDKNNKFKQLSFFSEEERCADSLTRKVTNKLLHNISTIKEKIDSGKQQMLVDEYEEQRISGNFLEALNCLNLESDDTILQFTAEWSPVVKKNKLEYDSVSISNAYYQPIAAVIDKIKYRPPSTKEIVGRVQHLDAAPAADERKKGTIIISYIGSDGKSHNITTTLDITDYDVAIYAHKHGKYIKALGELTQKGKTDHLDCSSFNIIE